MTGPVQVLVVGFDGFTFSGEVMTELDRLRDAGTARLLDVLLVARGEDGTLETLPLPEEAPPGLGSLAAAILGSADPDVAGDASSAGSSDVPNGVPSDVPSDVPSGSSGAAGTLDGATWSLAEAIPVGTTAAVALVEHLWAVPLREAIGRAGGTALEETWLDRQDVERLERLVGGQGG